MELPRGATPVDFAYAVHTHVGNTCVAAKINRQLAPLRTQLETGQTVEIITAASARPNPNWLNFVVTGKARTHIRHFLKNLRRDEAVNLGRRLLNRSLDNFSLSLETLPQNVIQKTLEAYKLDSLEQLLADIGLGNRMALLVARKLAETQQAANRRASSRAGGLKSMWSRYVPKWLPGVKKSTTPLAIQGTEGIVVTYAKCCRPIPGDPILGIFNPGRGIVVHTQSCQNIREHKKHPEKWVELRWEKEPSGEYPVEIRVEVSNQRGVLATVAAAIADMQANIENVDLDQRDSKFTDLTLVISVKDRKHLANIIRASRRLDQVNKITRSRG